ncbi:hypothetical protein DY000_02048683 [Brassica cretica]|uniref:Uncharacterized protein n=1 Tax=Brassica cretica TaxID=69181 RepID=A0ABQ7ETJ1_BRACR|nr:hypothetical protein DY000_02048683 [Brassica cretica]
MLAAYVRETAKETGTPFRKTQAWLVAVKAVVFVGPIISDPISRKVLSLTMKKVSLFSCMLSSVTNGLAWPLRYKQIISIFINLLLLSKLLENLYIQRNICLCPVMLRKNTR